MFYYTNIIKRNLKLKIIKVIFFTFKPKTSIYIQIYIPYLKVNIIAYTFGQFKFRAVLFIHMFIILTYEGMYVFLALYYILVVYSLYKMYIIITKRLNAELNNLFLTLHICMYACMSIRLYVYTLRFT